MRVEKQVELARVLGLWKLDGVDESSAQIESSHEQLVQNDIREVSAPQWSIQGYRMKEGENRANRKSHEESCPEDPVRVALKYLKQRDTCHQASQAEDADKIEVSPDQVVQKGIVYNGAEGGGDHDRNADVINPPPPLVRLW